MVRPSLVLIAAIAVAVFAQSALGQFPSIPKITIPKITKNEPPSTATTPDASAPAAPTAEPSSPVSNNNVRGKPIAGAKMIFSSTPDGSNPKNNFSSSEYVYGRLDFGGKTMYDAFGWKAMGDRQFYYVSYHLSIFQPGKEPWEHDWHNGRTYVLVSKEDAKKTFWNFDVLPDPARASNLQSAIADELQYYHTMIGMYQRVSDVDEARRTFPQNGPYIVDITIFGDSYDDWGKPTGNSDEHLTASGRFTFNFSGTDGQTLVANSKKAAQTIENARNAKEMLRAMPSWWGTARVTEPKLAPARLVPMIKGFIAQWNLTYMKHAVYPHTGPLWTIEKNSLGIPTFRDLSPYIYIIYKDPSDNSCQFGALYMREPYAGAGRYGEPFLGGIREVKHIDCAVVK